MKEVAILGIPVASMPVTAVLTELRAALSAGRQVHLVTVNNEMVMRAQHDRAFRQTLLAADLRVPDSVGMVWAARFLERPGGYLRATWTLLQVAIKPRRSSWPITQTIPGSNLVEDIANMAQTHGYRLYLLGAAPGVAKQAGSVLASRYPRLKVVGSTSGSPDSAADARTCQQITHATAQIVLVAFGPPKQERWISRNLSNLPRPLIAVGVGGTFDYLTGAPAIEGGRPAKQPPRWLRRRGFEWLWRLGTQPHRLQRVLTAFPRFVRAVVRSSNTR